ICLEETAYGVISSVSRSDVNMIITVNPNTHKILVTSIPRDYYVSLAGKDGKDKLTHAGIYGIGTSVQTLENLLDIKINYYVKINFSSFVKIVDTLGGVSVYSKYDFVSRDGYHYQEGQNKVKGKEALSFVRERKAFSGGDRVRNMNQVAMIDAILEKATSAAIITKYNNLLNTLGDSFVTNLDKETITKFVKKQLKDNSKWEISSYALNGHDDYQYTYSYSGAKLYVMVPDNATVINAQNKIKEILNN
ncbi:MAG: LCP family protein, partial [Bacilli bacterium]|nr:LCP family protein [Bacilli bacterium]